MKKVYKYIVLAACWFGLLACGPEKTKKVVSQPKPEPTTEEKGYEPDIKKINQQLQLVDVITLVDEPKKMTLFDFQPYVGDVKIEKTNDSTMVFIGETRLPDRSGEYKTYRPIVLVVNYTPNSYKAYRDRSRETIPILDSADFTRILNQLNDLKKDSTIARGLYPKRQTASNEEDDDLDYDLKDEEVIQDYDANLTAAILNGCTGCRDVFFKQWPDILGDNMIAVIGEQHGWNEELILEYERKLP